MTVYLILAAVTCGLAFLVVEKCHTEYPESPSLLERGKSRVRSRNALVQIVIFLALFLVSACRHGIGHDYTEYVSVFSLISQNRYVSTEEGFNMVVRLCQWIFGPENYIIIFALFAFVTIWLFMVAMYEQSEHYGWTFFLFMTLGYYLSTFNTIRYYLVLAIALFSIQYIFRKEYVKFVFCILVASCFHMAVLFVLLAYPMALIKWNKITIPLVALFTGSLLLFPDFYRWIIFKFYPFYEGSVYDTGETSVINILRCAAVLVFALIFYKKALKGNKKNMFYFNLNLEALILYACCSFIPVISRIGYFLNISQILLIPAVLSSIEKKWVRRVFTVLVVIAGLAYFYLFLESGKDRGNFIVPYYNWILNYEETLYRVDV
ncbi:MAG: EpsG family protein [Lachnospiraceae bacterium]|nr:EpsG family protein [Lachnospiraceae bacterium]